MNRFFIPNEEEETLIEKILQLYREEFVLIRMTETMLDKSIIDANEKLRKILRNSSIVDFDDIEKEQKMFQTSVLIANETIELKTSYYRPKTKTGDPRFWLYNLKTHVKARDLLFLTTFQNQLVVIKLENTENFEKELLSIFGGEPDEDLILELITKLKEIGSRGWIKSISPNKSNPKDVGDTLEANLGIPVNNLKSADYKGKIEIKSKRKKARTKDSLFSKVPEWELSRCKSSADVILKYGYESRVHEGFHDLYVTVSNIPNKQRLYNLADENTQLLNQYYYEKTRSIDICTWSFDILQDAFETKHPKTVWIVADEMRIDGEIYFKYSTLELTKQPIFSQFTSLINQGIVTFDWRGKVKSDKTCYRDHGHGFRISPKNRHKLFGVSGVHHIL